VNFARQPAIGLILAGAIQFDRDNIQQQVRPRTRHVQSVWRWSCKAARWVGGNRPLPRQRIFGRRPQRSEVGAIRCDKGDRSPEMVERSGVDHQLARIFLEQASTRRESVCEMANDPWIFSGRSSSPSATSVRRLDDMGKLRHRMARRSRDPALQLQIRQP
jgi:hypothetical protein